MAQRCSKDMFRIISMMDFFLGWRVTLGQKWLVMFDVKPSILGINNLEILRFRVRYPGIYMTAEIGNLQPEIRIQLTMQRIMYIMYQVNLHRSLGLAKLFFSCLALFGLDFHLGMATNWKHDFELSSRSVGCPVFVVHVGRHVHNFERGHNSDFSAFHAPNILQYRLHGYIVTCM